MDRKVVDDGADRADFDLLVEDMVCQHQTLLPALLCRESPSIEFHQNIKDLLVLCTLLRQPSHVVMCVNELTRSHRWTGTTGG